MGRRTPLWTLVALAALVLSGCTTNAPPEAGELPPADEVSDGGLGTVAAGLDTVWEIAFSPDERIFVTERPGRVRVITPDQGLLDEPWLDVAAVAEVAESGLAGLALHPDFPATPHVFLYYTYESSTGLTNRVVRYTDDAGQGRNERVLLDGIPGSSIHDGGRIGFGPDGKLYITTGDAGNAANAQNPNSLAGKVLRINPDGSVPADNPDPSHPRWSLGHRNAQGLAWHPANGLLYAAEHGPENHDEVNVIQAGANYGWPAMRGKQGGATFEPAIWSSGPGGTVAPAGAAFVDAPDSPLHGALVFATLKAAQVHVLQISGTDPTDVVAEDIVLDGELGRLRAVTWGPDGALYLGTSNRDGRGSPGASDDRVVRVPLAVLEQAVGVAG